MSTYSEFFFASTSSVIEYETLEIYHPNFSTRFFTVRNASNGLNARLETYELVYFQYVPMRVDFRGHATDLDFGVDITLGDLGEILPQELALVRAASGFSTRPTVKYRAFASDALTAPMRGPFSLEIQEFAFTRDGCAFSCKPATLNRTRTGMPYSVNLFPTLRGFQ